MIYRLSVDLDTPPLRQHGAATVPPGTPLTAAQAGIQSRLSASRCRQSWKRT